VLLVAILRFVPPPVTSFMLHARLEATLAGQPFELRYQWRDIEHVSPHAAVAVVAAEDQRFPLHAGFDLESIRRAARHNERGGRIRGASTISQQVAKNLFLWPGRSWIRKGIEAGFTVLIETLWTKQRILEVYLNVAEFGPGIYGVEAASQRYFGKGADRLTEREAALLAAVLPSPRRYRVDQPGPWVKERRERIVRAMRALGGRQWLREVLPPARAAG
jgi:monofunctional biosynthetic peptidoglycan transglycosylase